jgi:hypothetical protein
LSGIAYVAFSCLPHRDLDIEALNNMLYDLNNNLSDSGNILGETKYSRTRLDQKKMSFVPSWSSFTLPRRGKICELHIDIADALTDEYRIASRARNLAAIALWETDSDSDGGEAEEDDDDGSSHSSSLCSTSWPPSDSDTDLEDSEYIPAELDYPIELDLDDIDVDSEDVDLAPGSQPFLRPRPAPAPSADLDMTPFPDTFTRAHLRALNFDFVSWHE